MEHEGRFSRKMNECFNVAMLLAWAMGKNAKRMFYLLWFSHALFIWPKPSFTTWQDRRRLFCAHSCRCTSLGTKTQSGQAAGVRLLFSEQFTHANSLLREPRLSGQLIWVHFFSREHSSMAISASTKPRRFPVGSLSIGWSRVSGLHWRPCLCKRLRINFLCFVHDMSGRKSCGVLWPNTAINFSLLPLLEIVICQTPFRQVSTLTWGCRITLALPSGDRALRLRSLPTIRSKSGEKRLAGTTSAALFPLDCGTWTTFFQQGSASSDSIA